MCRRSRRPSPPPSPHRPLYARRALALTSATDALDGFLARKGAQPPAFDPVADKLLVCTALVLLSGVLGAAVAVPTALIVGREIFVSALREWMATLGCVDRVAVSAWGKLKTATQMVALLVLLVAQPSAAPVAIPKGASAVPHLRDGLVLLWIAAALAVASAADYALAAARVFRERSGSAAAEAGAAVGQRRREPPEARFTVKKCYTVESSAWRAACRRRRRR